MNTAIAQTAVGSGFIRVGHFRINPAFIVSYMQGVAAGKPAEVHVQLHGMPSPLIIRTPGTADAERLMALLDRRLGPPG